MKPARKSTGGAHNVGIRVIEKMQSREFTKYELLQHNSQQGFNQDLPFVGGQSIVGKKSLPSFVQGIPY